MAYLLIFPLVHGGTRVHRPIRSPSALVAASSRRQAILRLSFGRSAAPPSAIALETSGWLALGPLGKLFLGFVSLLFFLCSLYAPGYLAVRAERPNRILCANLLVVLAMMTLVILSQHLGLMWVAMEAITLVSAPAIYFNHNGVRSRRRGSTSS